MVEVEDYNPFVIGLKLRPGIPLDKVMKDMKGILNDNEFKVPLEEEQPQKPQQIGFQIKFGPPVETLGIKDNVDVKLNLQTQSLNILGETPEEVMPIFEKVYELLPGLKYDVEELVPFYELVANAGIVTDAPPLEVLTNSVPKLNLAHLESEIDSDLSVIGIRIGSMKINLQNKDNTEIVIEPKKGSHSNRYTVRLKYQTRNKDNILKFDVKNELTQIISSLEGK